MAVFHCFFLCYNKGKKEALMTILCYPRCSTCKRTLAWLDERSMDYTYRDIQTENPTAQELAAWHKKSGLPLKRFFNTSGMAYRGLGLKYKLAGMTEKEQYALLATDGMLVKRPLVLLDGAVLVGFRPEEWAEKLK
jgi:arsenate reductase